MASPRRRTCPNWRAWLSIAALSVAMQPPPAQAVGTQGLFGSNEVRDESIHMFPKWTAVLERFRTHEEPMIGSCDPAQPGSCTLTEWAGFIDGLAGLDDLNQLREVQAHLRSVPYILDHQNWGTEDYWETPLEFLTRAGDCEDYSIAKYFSLRRLGFSADQLRIVVLQDENLRLLHAVLAVYLDGDILILDNQIPQVVSHTSIHHYRPLYSINEEAWWSHI